MAEDQTLVGAMECVFTAYANRPALGTRAYEIVRDPATSNAVRSYLPRFSTITYGQVQSTVKVSPVPGSSILSIGSIPVRWSALWALPVQYAMLDYVCLSPMGLPCHCKVPYPVPIVRHFRHSESIDSRFE